jgi:hypothetical protein
MCYRAIALTLVSFVFLNSAAPAQVVGDHVTCTGTLIDVWLKPKGSWPLAVIYDADKQLTCAINREGSGHDPLKPCGAGEQCRVTGSYRKLGQGNVTYAIQRIETVEREGRK